MGSEMCIRDRDYIVDLTELTTKIEQCLDTGRVSFDFPELYLEEKYLSIKGRRIINGMILTIEDFTKSKEIELANLNAVLHGQELERKRLAREIHDGIGPLISTIKLNIDGMKAELNGYSAKAEKKIHAMDCLLYTSPSPRDLSTSRMPSSA